MNYLIEITGVDDQGYNYTEYFKSVYTDEFGIVRVSTTKNPLEAKLFVTVEPENRNSILMVIKNVMRSCNIKVKTLNYTVS
ncbi:MAG: hypothetical protein II630_07065 [Bacteroidales bacterium]|nr:hypothetical protein [Bacteroidales bacterium]